MGPPLRPPEAREPSPLPFPPTAKLRVARAGGRDGDAGVQLVVSEGRQTAGVAQEEAGRGAPELLAAATLA